MNTLHKFVVEDENGKDKEVGLRKPTRREIDEADMEYSAYMSDCITRGILTKEMLLKRYKDFGGSLSEDELKGYRMLLKRMMEINRQIQTTKAKKKREALEKELDDVFAAVQEVEQDQAELFGRTAEVIARNKTILWLALLLSYDVKDETPLFDGMDHDERYDSYAEIEERDLDFAQRLIEKICVYVSFWYSNKNVKPEDFEALEKFLEEQDKAEKKEGEQPEEEEDAADSGGDN